MSDKKFYITTPLYYVTAAPHLGSLYSTVLADVCARWQRLRGADVFLTTGTDEHGQKVAQAAQQATHQPQAFVDQFIPAYTSTWQQYEIAYNAFVRTTSMPHKMGAQEFVRRLIASGNTYRATYQGWYCTPCETFVGRGGSEQDAPIPCTSCNRMTSWVAEDTYFFKLSAYQEQLLSFYQNNPDFIAPKERLNEVISFVQEGLKDLSISRTTVQWGVSFPDQPEQVIYVWVEALCGYLTSVGFGQEERRDEFNYWWPADVQVMGKDIVKFHAIYWPAMLLAAGLPLPKRLLVHGWIKVDKQKMSKSLGNVVDPVPLGKQYGVDAVRYFLCRQLATNQDGEFSIEALEQHIASDLANDLGNLLNRVSVLAHMHNIFEITAPHQWSERSMRLRNEAWSVVQDAAMHMHDWAIHLAIARIWHLVNQANTYFHELEPWKLAKSDKDHFVQVLSATAHALYTISLLLWPIMPTKMAELFERLGTPISFGSSDFVDQLKSDNWRHTFLIKQGPALFEKPIKKEEQPVVQKEQSRMPTISIDEFLKTELLVGTIREASAVPHSDKLLKLIVDFGPYGTKQILAGVAKQYSSDLLMNKQALFVTNLQPRIMAGLESQGMMLMAKDEQGIARIMQSENVVPNGTRLQ